MSKRPLLLDLFCGAGGAAMGYYRAGFDIIGVDIKKQSRYPFLFIRGNALQPPIDLGKVDAIHASPPCQLFSECTRTAPVRRNHPNLIPEIRSVLLASGLPFIIENVPYALPFLSCPVQLCGSSFGLMVRRHRLFEAGRFHLHGIECAHHLQDIPRFVPNRSGRTRLAKVCSVAGHGGSGSCGRGGKQPVQDWRLAMMIDWMRRDELAQAIPPAYTEFIGRQLIKVL